MTPLPHSVPTRLLWSLPAAAAFLLLQVLLAPQAVVYPDTARYAQLALLDLGHPAAQAFDEAVGLVCTDHGEQAARANPETDPAAVERDCRAAQAAHLEPTGDPRYQRMFDTRPGYPAVVAALTPQVGLKAALWAVPVGCTVLAGLIVFWLLRRAGLPPGAAVAGQVALYVLPLGWWGTQMLTEGPVLFGVLAVTAGAVVVAGGRLPGIAGMVAGFAELAAVKFSTAALLAAALGGVAVFGALIDADRRRWWAIVAACSVACAGGLTELSRLLGWPGLRDTMQDLATVHYTKPDVPDVWTVWISANQRYWEHWPNLLDTNVALGAGVLAAVGLLWRWDRGVALPVLAVALVGVAATIALPSAGELGRLYVLAWMPIVFGVSALAGSRRSGGAAGQVPTSSTTRKHSLSAAPSRLIDPVP